MTVLTVADLGGGLDRINAFRREAGLRPLVLDAPLSSIALAHARGMARRGVVTSLTAEGGGVLSRLEAEGISPSLAASVTAGGYPRLIDAIEVWTASPTERRHLLLPEATKVGLAFVAQPDSPYRYYVEAIIVAP